MRALRERAHRLVRAPGLPKHDSQGERRLGESRIEVRRTPQLGLRVGEVVLLFERNAQVVPRFGIGGLEA